MKPCVAHSVGAWLPTTMVWLFNQLKYMERFAPIVLALTTQNAERFPWEPFYANRSPYNQLFYRVLRKLGISRYPSIYDQAVARHHPLLLHSHFGHIAWHDLPLASRYGLPHVVSFYGVDVNWYPTRYPYWKTRYRQLFDRADLFLCEGPHMAKCLKALGCPAEKIRLQKLGVEVEKIPYKARILDERGPIKILLAGAFRETKGIPYALQAIGMLREKYPTIQVTLIGDAEPRHGAEKRKILHSIKRWGLEKVTRMLGFTTHQTLLREAYDHHIFLSPSITTSSGDMEGGAPVTILEMSASGMPVLSTWHCDIPFIVRHEVTGLLCRERDSQGLAQNADRLLSDPERLAKMGQAGHEMVHREYNVKSLSSSLEQLYENLRWKR